MNITEKHIEVFKDIVKGGTYKEVSQKHGYKSTALGGIVWSVFHRICHFKEKKGDKLSKKNFAGINDLRKNANILVKAADELEKTIGEHNGTI